jgi:hypothetical protein
MMQNIQGFFGGRGMLPFGDETLFLGGGIFLLALIVWSVVWKGLALWKAAHEESKPWFVALLVINTMGILEILYIYAFSKKGESANDGVVKS